MQSKSHQYYERALQVAPGGVHSPVRAFKNVECKPVFMRRGKGAWIEDVDQNRYLDFCMSWGPLILGHAHQEVLAEVEPVLRDGWTFGTAEEHSLEFAEFLVQRLPWIQKIRFVNSGTEAVMSALRLARAATGKTKIVKFDGCYHGHVDALLVAAGSGLAEESKPDSAGITKAQAAETVVLPLANLQAVEDLFERDADIAAVIIEPLPANNGLLLPEKAYLKGLRSLCTKRGVLLIFDEVISGFRVGLGGMSAWAEVHPDIVTYGKIIGGGFPVGAYGARAEIMDWVAPLGPVYQAGTLAANPVAMRAGLTTLKILDRDQPYLRLEAMQKKFVEQLAAKNIPVEAQGFASLFWLRWGKQNIQLPQQIPSTQKSAYGRLFPRLLAKGFYLAPSGYEVGFISTVHEESHLEQLVDAIVHTC